MIRVRIFSIVLGIILVGNTGGVGATEVVANRQWSWDEFWLGIVGRRRQDPPLGSRGGTICLVTPVSTGKVGVPVIWREVPIVVWQGLAGRMEVYDQQTKELMGSRLLPIGRSQVAYVGKPLLPGRTYDLKLLSMSNASIPPEYSTFQMMSVAERKTIDRLLDRRSVEERTHFWVERENLNEAIAELYQAEGSPEVREVRQQLQDGLCLYSPS